MLKVIRFDKKIYGGKKYNNILYINNELALANGMSTLNNTPKRRAYRKYIIDLCNNNPNLIYSVSQKDIRRLECANKCELPINVVDILEVIVSEIKKAKDKINYRAQDDYIISLHILTQTLNSLEDFHVWLENNHFGDRPECDKYRDGVDYIRRRLDEFNKKYPGIFNSLFD